MDFLTYKQPVVVNKMNQKIMPEEIPFPLYSIEEHLTWKKEVELKVNAIRKIVKKSQYYDKIRLLVR